MKKLIVSISCVFATLHADAVPMIQIENIATKGNPIVIVNGYKIRYMDYPKIKPEHIESFIELDAKDAVEIFGSQGENGAIVIKLIPQIKPFTSERAKIDEQIIKKVAGYAETAKQREAARKAYDLEEQRLKAIEKARLEEEEARKVQIEEQQLDTQEKTNPIPDDIERKLKEAETESKRLERGAELTKAEAEKKRLETEEKERKEAEAERKRVEGEE